MTRRVLLHLSIAALAFGALAAASHFQEVWHLQPCTMCILQRYAFFIIGFAALSPYVLRGWALLPLMPGISGLATVVGITASLKIQWAISVPSMSCGRDKVAAVLNGLPWVDHWPAMFEATGVCGDPVPPVMGLPFHVCSLLLFGLILVLSVAAGRAGAKPTPSQG